MCNNKPCGDCIACDKNEFDPSKVIFRNWGEVVGGAKAIDIDVWRKKGANMAKVVEVWEYQEGDSQFESMIDILKENRKIVVIFDKDNDEDSFLIVGNVENEKRDLAQAQMILELTDSDEFKSL